MSKIKRKACSSLKELLKIERKYTKKFFGGRRSNYNYRTYWYTWVWYDAIGMDALNDEYLNKYADKLAAQGYRNLKCIINEIKVNYGWSYEGKDGIIFRLCGLEISNEDYYYIYMSEDGQKTYSSCVGSYDDVC